MHHLPWPDTTSSFELKYELIHLLPTFRGSAGEDFHKNLKVFHIVFVGMRSHGVTQEQLNIREFSFLLKDNAKDLLHYLPSSSITT